MNLFLIQHGQAKTTDDDPSRPLTADGAETVRAMAAFAARHGVKIEQIRHSGKVRARETAEIFAEPLGPPGGVVAVPGLNANDDVYPVGEALAHENKPLMVVGHLPFLGRLTGFLLAGDAAAEPIRFRNAGIVLLVRADGRWSLDWAITPEFIK